MKKGSSLSTAGLGGRGVVEAVTVRAALDPYLSMRALAAYSALSRRTLQTLVNDPMDPIPSYRVGRKILVRPSEFDAWMARRRDRRAEALARLAAADAQPLLAARPKREARRPVAPPPYSPRERATDAQRRGG